VCVCVCVCSIASVVLDAVGGSLSLLQLLLDCGASGDWSGIAGDPVKLALGALTLLYDGVYLAQHAWFGHASAQRETSSKATESDHALLLESD